MMRTDPYLERERNRALQRFVSMGPAAIAHEIEMVQTRIDREVAKGLQPYELTTIRRKWGKARGDLCSCLVARIAMALDRQPAGSDRPSVLELDRGQIMQLTPDAIVAHCADVETLWMQTEGAS